MSETPASEVRPPVPLYTLASAQTLPALLTRPSEVPPCRAAVFTEASSEVPVTSVHPPTGTAGFKLS